MRSAGNTNNEYILELHSEHKPLSVGIDGGKTIGLGTRYSAKVSLFDSYVMKRLYLLS